jgi:hypothetical protein
MTGLKESAKFLTPNVLFASTSEMAVLSSLLFFKIEWINCQCGVRPAQQTIHQLGIRLKGAATILPEPPATRLI